MLPHYSEIFKVVCHREHCAPDPYVSSKCDCRYFTTHIWKEEWSVATGFFDRVALVWAVMQHQYLLPIDDNPGMSFVDYYHCGFLG